MSTHLCMYGPVRIDPPETLCEIPDRLPHPPGGVVAPLVSREPDGPFAAFHPSHAPDSTPELPGRASARTGHHVYSTVVARSASSTSSPPPPPRTCVSFFPTSFGQVSSGAFPILTIFPSGSSDVTPAVRPPSFLPPPPMNLGSRLR